MQRTTQSTGLLGLLVAAVRAHLAETLLIALAALAFLLGALWQDDAAPAVRAYVGEERTDEIDATYVSTLLEIRDGVWAVRDRDTVAQPTLGLRSFHLQHAADTGMLFPESKALWAVGGPLLRRRVPDWAIEAEYRVVLRNSIPAAGIEEAYVSAGGWRIPSFSGVELIDTPAIPSGFNPLGRPMTYAPGDGVLLHVAVLTSGDPQELTDIAAWRAMVASAADRLAADLEPTRTATNRIRWWRTRQGAVVQTAALAALLRVPAAAGALAELRSDLDRDFTPPNPGNRFYEADTRATIDGALALLSSHASEQDADGDVIRLLRHFAAPSVMLSTLADTHAGTPGGDLLRQLTSPTSIWAERGWYSMPMPSQAGWLQPLLLLAVIGLLAAGGTARVRRRDALALLATLLFASSGALIVEHVTAESLGLMALAVLVTRLTRRGALTVPRGVPRAWAIAAVLLPLASALRVPTLDAAGRAVAFAGVAWMAVGTLATQAPASEAPRRPERKRSVLWVSFQLLAVSGSVLALLLAMLDPTTWDTRTPGTKWILIGIGLVLALGAGIVAFARGGRTRPQPAALCAVTMGASVHLVFLAVSPFPHGRLSGAGELGRIGMMAAAVAALFVVLRLFVLARAHRELPAAMEPADHRPR